MDIPEIKKLFYNLVFYIYRQLKLYRVVHIYASERAMVFF